MASNAGQARKMRDNSKAGFEKREKRRQIRALQEAIDEHDTEVVKKILEDDFDVDFQYRSQTALQQAVKKGYYDICQLLIDKGANVNMADAEHNNLLNMACYRGHKDIVELLVKNSANIDAQNTQGYSVIHTCAAQDSTDILQILISSDGNLDSANFAGETALHTAVKQRNHEAVQLLVFGGCNIDKADEHRRTPLMAAAEMGYSEIAQLLINGGAGINKQDKTGSTPLFEAVVNGHMNVVQELASSGADINLATTKGISPLIESISRSHTDISLFLINAKCDVNQADRHKLAPLHHVTSKVSQFFSEETEYALLVRSLVEAGSDLNAANMQGETPLYQSACGGSLELTEYFISKGADITVATNNGDTILHAGVHGNNPEVVRALIGTGCALDQANNSGEHPLLTAVTFHSNIKIIEALVMAGSNLNIKNSTKSGGNTALHTAIVHYYSEAAVLLIDQGCDIHALNQKKQSPLYLACEKNDDIAKKLLNSPKFSKKMFQIPNIPQPMFAAVGNGHVNLIKLLIDAGCDINLVNSDGFSPVLFAINENRPFVTKLLLKFNCDLLAHSKVKRLMKCCLLHEDVHPHFDLEPLFLALTHKNVELLQLLIKCYYVLPIKTIKMLDKVFLSTPDLRSHYTPELRSEIHQLFMETTKNPRSLQEGCRAVARRCIGSCPSTKVAELPVAIKIKDYLLMEEFFGNLEEQWEEDDKKHPTDFHGFHSFDLES